MEGNDVHLRAAGALTGLRACRRVRLAGGHVDASEDGAAEHEEQDHRQHGGAARPEDG